MKKIDLLLLPVDDDFIMIPKSIVEYVLPYATPLPGGHNHKAVIGSIIYKESKVPILNILKLRSGSAAQELIDNQDDYKNRLVFIKSTTAENPFDYYAIVTTAAPRATSISEESIREIKDDGAYGDLIYSKVEIINLKTSKAEYNAYTFDLAKLEKEIFKND